MRPNYNSRAYQQHSQPKAIAISASRINPFRSAVIQTALLGLLYTITLWLVG